MAPRQYSKKRWRDKNAAFVQEARRYPGQQLVDPKSGQVRCRVLDLAGEQPQVVWESYQRILGDASQLMLVEKDRAVHLEALFNLARMPVGHRPHLVKNDVYTLGFSINNQEGIDKGPLIGVFSLDLVANTGKLWWDAKGKGLDFFDDTVNPAIKAFNASVVILNHTLDGREGHEDAVQRFEDHIVCLRRFLRRHTGRDYARSELVPSESVVRDRIFGGTLGYLGVVEIYQSEDHVLRMATIRMHLQKGKCHFDRGEKP